MAFSDNAEQEDKRNRAVVKKDFLVRRKWAVSENTDNLVRFVASMGDSDLKPHCDNSSNKACHSVTQMVQCISDFHERELLY